MKGAKQDFKSFQRGRKYLNLKIPQLKSTSTKEYLNLKVLNLKVPQVKSSSSWKYFKSKVP